MRHKLNDFVVDSEGAKAGLPLRFEISANFDPFEDGAQRQFVAHFANPKLRCAIIVAPGKT